MKLPVPWTENCAALLRAFNKEGVEYLLFGSMAKSHYHSLPSVGDMDVLINPTPENATKVKSALGARGESVSEGEILEEWACEEEGEVRQWRHGDGHTKTGTIKLTEIHSFSTRNQF